ncbi:pleiotropic drug resistance abc transporter [Moniliophthora roreri]|nr:pleiotropic drug resistance abc transporter [Moniliophthora roreri]
MTAIISCPARPVGKPTVQYQEKGKKNRVEGVPWQFDEDLRIHESRPAVSYNIRLGSERISWTFRVRMYNTIGWSAMNTAEDESAQTARVGMRHLPNDRDHGNRLVFMLVPTSLWAILYFMKENPIEMLLKMHNTSLDKMQVGFRLSSSQVRYHYGVAYRCCKVASKSGRRRPSSWINSISSSSRCFQSGDSRQIWCQS